MCIIHNGQLVPDNENILLERWKYKSVFGEEKATVPEFCVFNNTAYALDLWKPRF